MSVKKIVKTPTPESSPFLYYGDGNEIIGNFNTRIGRGINQSFSPVSFDDISTVRNLKKKYRSMVPKMSWRGKFCDLFAYQRGTLLGFFLFLSVVAIASVATSFAIISLDSFIDNELLTFVLIMIVSITMVFCVTSSCSFVYDKITDFNNLPISMKYHIKFHKKDKKLLQGKTFLNTSRYDKREKHLNIVKSINKVFNHIEDANHSNSVDLYELKNLYNEYMRLLSFVLTNKDNISQELFDNYDKQLDELSQNIVKESDNIIAIIKDENDYMKKNKEKLDTINQEILDNDAIKIFPMK